MIRLLPTRRHVRIFALAADSHGQAALKKFARYAGERAQA